MESISLAPRPLSHPSRYSSKVLRLRRVPSSVIELAGVSIRPRLSLSHFEQGIPRTLRGQLTREPLGSSDEVQSAHP